MRNAFRPSGARATVSFSQQFNRSRLVLTLCYVVILAAVVFASGGVTRVVYGQRLDLRFNPYANYNGPVPDAMPSPPRADDLRRDLHEVTMIVDWILLIVAGGLSYVLAGITLRPIQEAYDSQRRFLSDASHELRTPLAILQTDLENERLRADDASRARVDSHLEEVGRMRRLVNDLLTLARLADAGDAPAGATPQVVNVAKITADSVARLRGVAEARKVTLAIEPAEPELPVAVASEDQLMQAITNLVHNAILYNVVGGKVTVAPRRDGKEVVVAVTDTGIGIAPQDLGRVFERFYRADKSRSRETGGNGLGLSIVKAIVEAAGGTVSATSEPGKGTVMTLRLPVHSAS